VYDWNNVIQGFLPSYNRLAKPEFAKKAYEASPIAVMDGWKSPVLLIHGDDDRNVPFNETVLKAGKLRELGVEFEQLVFPDEVHGFLLHENWYRAYQATRDFFDRKLK
jgi:dipeptidyl aminopeptidase/acylaminoacyl peptidase